MTYVLSGTPYMSRGESGYIYAHGKMRAEPRIYDHVNRCTSAGCAFWSYDDAKAARHTRRKRHETRREDT